MTMTAAAEAPMPSPAAGDAAAAECRAGDAAAALAQLRAQGYVVLDGLLESAAGVAAAAMTDARDAVRPLLAAVVAGWDAETDKLAVSWAAFGLTRAPRVNQGKKNLHLDPHSAAGPHVPLTALVSACGLPALVSSYVGSPCSVAECGLSVTRPLGAGMEWHADGSEGEATVLMALDDVSPELGSLGLIPGSHTRYSPGEDGAIERVVADGTRVWYAYRSGVPCVIDARTLHAAGDNGSATAWRCVAWFIFNRDAGPGGGE